MSNEPNATLDFETRSACDIRSCGSWKYAEDPTTEVLCMAYRLPHWPKGVTALWHPAFPAIGMPASEDDTTLQELFTWIVTGHPVEAHNAQFERGIWRRIMVPRHGWPDVPNGSWRCSAAKAAAHALPRHLKDVTVALKLKTHKDEEGSKVMRKVSAPRKAKKAEVTAWRRLHAPCAECRGTGKHKVGRQKATPCLICGGRGSSASGFIPEMPLLWHESIELYARLFAYCRQDVLAEEAVSETVPDLSPDELETYLLDQEINERGVYIDAPAVDCALKLIASEVETLNAELATVTEGVVTRATQRAKLTTWLGGHGVFLEDTQKQTITDTLAGDNWDAGEVEGAPRRALEILQELGKSSTAKYEAMKNWSCGDSRVRGSLLYHGASTGRWSGVGMQPQNFAKGTIKKWDMDDSWMYMLHSDRDQIVSQWGSVMAPLSQAVRGAITASPGKRLFVADYASIEARVLLWLAGDDDALELFRTGGDIYCDMASHIYGHPVNKKEHPDKRQLGKVAILGLGYQMGGPKFVDSAASYGITITEDFAKEVVDAYRDKFLSVKTLWSDQERAMCAAIDRPGEKIIKRGVEWLKEGDYVYAILPSDRRLAYPFPSTRMVLTPWGDRKAQPSFWGINPKNHQWQRQSTYGGMIVENLVQAISRDIMAHAMKGLAATGRYDVLLTVHDELVTEAHPLLGTVEEFVSIVSDIPDWAEGCPIEAEGWSGVRYRK